jgi:uncharacterized repeat protein (TIGR01451 family)
MTRMGRTLGLLVLAALLCAPTAGCLGLATNPSYFPYLLPFGDVITTHDKPIWPGNDANFDPKANTIVLMPVESTSRVRTQHVLLATVYDSAGQPLRNRTVKWEIEGAGSLIEVDSDGVVPGRGHLIDRQYGVSYTRWHDTRISRGNGNTADDFMVRPGQTYCVVTSPVEGDTHVTVYAPGIFDWDKRVAHTTVRWVDVHWEFPPRGVARFGTEHVFNTRLMRFTDRRPLQGYEVRYKILDGPPAYFLPNRTQEVIVKSNADGDALARIVQAAPSPGANRVSVDVLRPPDPTTPSGSVVPIASGETAVEWLAPSVSLSHSGPPAVPINQEVTFTTVVSNTGQIESRAITTTIPIPDGLQFARANPPGFQNGNDLIWTLANLAPGQTYTIQTTFVAKRPGQVTCVASMVTGEGQKDEKAATTQVTVPDLTLELQGPPTAFINQPVRFVVTLRNPGGAVLENVQVEAQFDEGLEFGPNPKSQRLTLGLNGPPIVLAPQQSQTVDLDLTPRKAGQLGIKVIARAGNLVREKSAVLLAQAPKLSLDVIEGPQKRFAGRPGEWKIRVANEGDVPLTNVMVRDRLPPELEFEAASDNGQANLGEVTWNLGTLEPRSQRVLIVKAKATRPVPAAVQIIAATADPGLNQQTQKALEIVGLGALDTNLTDLDDPLEVGKVGKYQLEITNRGSAPISNLVVRARASAELKPGAAAGPSGAMGMVDGQTVTFGKLDGLQPGAKVTFTFEAQAVMAGDARFEVQITSDVNMEPLRLQESTRVVAPLPGPGGNTPPPPPNGGTVKPLPPG